MNAAQLQQIARTAGWPENLLVTIAAIALAESSGILTKHNTVPPDDSYGLWQINMIGKLGPARRQLFGIATNSALYDPLTNARAALAIYQQQGLRAWSTYLYGQYKKWLPQSQAAYAASGAVPQDITADGGPQTVGATVNDSIALPKNVGPLLLLGMAGLGLYLWLR